MTCSTPACDDQALLSDSQNPTPAIGAVAAAAQCDECASMQREIDRLRNALAAAKQDALTAWARHAMANRISASLAARVAAVSPALAPRIAGALTLLYPHGSEEHKRQLAQLNASASQPGDAPHAWLSGDAHGQWIDHAQPKLGLADGEGLVADWAEPLAGPRTLELVRAALAEQEAAKRVEVPAPEVTQSPVAVVDSWTNGSRHRNYKLRWLREVGQGAKLYAAPIGAVAAAAEAGTVTDQQVKAVTDILRLKFAIYLTPSSVRQVLSAALCIPACAGLGAVKTDALPDVGAMVANAKNLEQIARAGERVFSPTVLGYLNDIALQIREYVARDVDLAEGATIIEGWKK